MYGRKLAKRAGAIIIGAVSPTPADTVSQTFFFSVPPSQATSVTCVYWSSSASDQVAARPVERLEWVAAVR